MRALLVLAACFVAGCPSSTGSPDAGLDAPALADAPSALDVPSVLDVPALDTPTPADARRDAPASDVPDGCTGLAAAACIVAGCVPGFDDSCCSACTPGPCADCTNIDWNGCQAWDASPCAGGCGTAPDWVCGDVLPSCAGANVIDVDSCDRTGCVPSFPSGTGDPDPGTATCTPITAISCTVACRRLPPPCPTGTFPEGDGSCYTDRCIPSFVCLMR